MDIYQHRRHNKNLLMVHLIFVTKYRKKLLLGDFRDAVKQYLFDTCVKNHWYIKRMETDQDHIHILLQYENAMIGVIASLRPNAKNNTNCCTL